jgi:hypothetical protein
MGWRVVDLNQAIDRLTDRVLERFDAIEEDFAGDVFGHDDGPEGEARPARRPPPADVA